MSDPNLNRVERAYRRIGSRWAWNAVAFAGFQGLESRIRRRTVEHLELQRGDGVLDVACGRGSNFPYLQRVVGAQGRIVGVDYSGTMLEGAEHAVREKGWKNVELVQGDAAEVTYRSDFDGVLCTIAMAVIPRWQEALRGMLAAVRPGKRIAIMDGQRPTGLARIGTPYAYLFSRIVAAHLDRDVRGECLSLLTGVREEAHLFGAYFIISGTERSSV
jgi:ubiquinone/menaquinone biosynthesis C-methylase UbiE